MFNIGDTVVPTYAASWKEGIVYAVTETLIHYTVTAINYPELPFATRVGSKVCDCRTSLKVIPPVEQPYDPLQEPDEEDDV